MFDCRIFVEKITYHPEYKAVPIAERKQMMGKSGEVFEKAERLKQTLLSKYEGEHTEYKERLRLQEEAKRKAEEARKTASTYPIAPISSLQPSKPQPEYIITPSAPKAISHNQDDDTGYATLSLGELSLDDKVFIKKLTGLPEQ